jgi:hypothetical protein
MGHSEGFRGGHRNLNGPFGRLRSSPIGAGGRREWGEPGAPREAIDEDGLRQTALGLAATVGAGVRRSTGAGGPGDQRPGQLDRFCCLAVFGRRSFGAPFASK